LELKRVEVSGGFTQVDNRVNFDVNPINPIVKSHQLDLLIKVRLSHDFENYICDPQSYIFFKFKYV